jgi:hypothetical protein
VTVITYPTSDSRTFQLNTALEPQPRAYFKHRFTAFTAVVYTDTEADAFRTSMDWFEITRAAYDALPALEVRNG